jgi:hypothetical protein
MTLAPGMEVVYTKKDGTTERRTISKGPVKTVKGFEVVYFKGLRGFGKVESCSPVEPE